MFLTDLVGWLNTFLTGYVSGVVGGLSAALAGIATAMVTIYILNYGISVMRNDVAEPVDVFAWKAMKLGFITTFALAGGIYMSKVHSAFDDLQNGMAVVFISGGIGGASDITSAYQAMDIAYEAADVRLQAIRAEADIIDDFDLVIADVLFTFGLWIFLIVAAAVTLMSKVFLAFALTLGPMAILCLLFQRTAKFFDSWLGFALSAVVVTWFAFFAMGLGLWVLDQITVKLLADGAFDPDAGGVSPLKGAGAFLCISVLMAILLMQAPKLAAALTGGAAMTTGAAGAAGYVLGRMGGGSSGGSGGTSDGGRGGNSVHAGGGLSYGAGNAAGRAAGYAFQRVSSLMSRRR